MTASLVALAALLIGIYLGIIVNDAIPDSKAPEKRK